MRSLILDLAAVRPTSVLHVCEGSGAYCASECIARGVAGEGARLAALRRGSIVQHLAHPLGELTPKAKVRTDWSAPGGPPENSPVPRWTCVGGRLPKSGHERTCVLYNTGEARARFRLALAFVLHESRNRDAQIGEDHKGEPGPSKLWGYPGSLREAPRTAGRIGHVYCCGR